MRKKILVLSLATLFGALSMSGVVNAESKKVDCRSVEVLVGFGAGGGTDLFVRSVTDSMEDSLGVPVQVINMPGSTGGLAFRDLTKRPADGCTILATVTDYIVGEANGQSDLSLIEETDPLVRAHVDIGTISVSHDNAAADWNALVEKAKEDNKTVFIGGIGAGSFDEAVVNILLANAGIEHKFVPYDGAKEMAADLLGGRLDAIYDEVGVMEPLVKADQARVMFISFDKRLDMWPDVPTADELGLKTSPPLWRGMAVKKGTPEETRAVLEAAVTKALDADKYKDYAHQRALDVSPGFMDSEQFSKVLDDELKDFKAVFQK